jgi:hypothetical protein
LNFGNGAQRTVNGAVIDQASKDPPLIDGDVEDAA